jgi:hypothetical protein
MRRFLKIHANAVKVCVSNIKRSVLGNASYTIIEDE